MDHPPICNYEGSDYQASFWDKGGRGYEDAVEALALERLLPKSGRLMLELGAGAGRNTPRYQGFEQIVLVDYSRTQLMQARDKLGESPRYRYIAADIYRLPFVSGLFNCATMIRTLHHMAEPRQALDQVSNTLQKGACFILEFPNKHNLKAILRYALHRQSWNPASPEPVEFASLNYDFHPAAVRSWLQFKRFCCGPNAACFLPACRLDETHSPLEIIGGTGKSHAVNCRLVAAHTEHFCPGSPPW